MTSEQACDPHTCHHCEEADTAQGHMCLEDGQDDVKDSPCRSHFGTGLEDRTHRHSEKPNHQELQGLSVHLQMYDILGKPSYRDESRAGVEHGSQAHSVHKSVWDPSGFVDRQVETYSSLLKTQWDIFQQGFPFQIRTLRYLQGTLLMTSQYINRIKINLNRPRYTRIICCSVDSLNNLECC